jgi:hypothetical protein
VPGLGGGGVQRGGAEAALELHSGGGWKQTR